MKPKQKHLSSYSSRPWTPSYSVGLDVGAPTPENVGVGTRLGELEIVPLLGAPQEMCLARRRQNLNHSRRHQRGR